MKRAQAMGDPTNEQAIRGDHAAPFSIDTVRFRDIGAIRRVQEASFRPGLAYTRGALYTLWLLPNVAFIIARNQATGEAIGCAIGDRYRGGLRVMNLAVSPEWRRLGVGGALLRALGERMPEGDITLMVEEFNRPAQALYEREGFVRTGFARNYYGPNRNGIQMVLHRGDTAANGILRV